jgi:cell wall-associated NlpC family hydrolase
VLSVAYSKIGCPYVWGAGGPNSFDCSGLVQYCYAQAGVSVGHYTGSLIGLPQVSDPQPGDIVVVHNNTSQHCGIYIGGGQMIHAPQPGQNVCISSVQAGMIYVRPNY